MLTLSATQTPPFHALTCPCRRALQPGRRCGCLAAMPLTDGGTCRLTSAHVQSCLCLFMCPAACRSSEEAAGGRCGAACGWVADWVGGAVPRRPSGAKGDCLSRPTMVVSLLALSAVPQPLEHASSRSTNMHPPTLPSMWLPADRIVTDHDRQGAEKVSLFFAKYYANCECTCQQQCSAAGCAVRCGGIASVVQQPGASARLSRSSGSRHSPVPDVHRRCGIAHVSNSVPSRADKFKHFPVVRAVNAATSSVYCMWDDEVRRWC